jgi:hypothetical protein
LQLLRVSAGEAIVNDQHVIIYDGYSQRKQSFWSNLLPKVTKKVLKVKPDEYKTVKSVSLII